jgi:hypothetical protein
MKYTISETADYEVEAGSAQGALDRFLNTKNIGEFDCTVHEREVFDANGEQAEVEDQ